MNLRAASQILNKTKEFFESLKYYLRMETIDSDADLNCSWTKFKGRKMLFSVKLLTKIVKIIYALGSVHEKFGVWIKAAPKAKFPTGLRKRTAEPLQIETGVPENEKFAFWTGP